MRIKTLQNTTAEEVNSTVCHWRGWAQSRGHTGILGSVAAWGAHASVCPPMRSVGVQQIHKPRGRKHQEHDDGCSRGHVPRPQQMNQRPEQPLGLGHHAHSSTFLHAGVILPSPNAFLLPPLQVSAILDSLEVKAFQSNTNITQT